jgi:putative ABC transport system ATP-binding protein
LFASCDKAGATLVFVSHDLTLQPLFKRTVELSAINTASQTGKAD